VSLEVSLTFSRRPVAAFLLVLASVGCGDKKSIFVRILKHGHHRLGRREWIPQYRHG
jgi:hypothetical protein